MHVFFLLVGFFWLSNLAPPLVGEDIWIDKAVVLYFYRVKVDFNIFLGFCVASLNYCFSTTLRRGL